MKRSVVAFLTTQMLWLNVGPLAAVAQTNNDFVSGQIVKIDESAAKITIKHGPLKKFDMDEGMTMVWHVTDPTMLKTVKPGDKILFVPDRINGQLTVIKIEKVK